MMKEAKRKAGRPALPDRDLKKVFPIRLTDGEKERYEAAAQAAGMLLSEWSRQALAEFWEIETGGVADKNLTDSDLEGLLEQGRKSRVGKVKHKGKVQDVAEAVKEVSDWKGYSQMEGTTDPPKGEGYTPKNLGHKDRRRSKVITAGGVSVARMPEASCIKDKGAPTIDQIQEALVKDLESRPKGCPCSGWAFCRHCKFGMCRHSNNAATCTLPECVALRAKGSF